MGDLMIGKSSVNHPFLNVCLYFIARTKVSVVPVKGFLTMVRAVPS